MTPVAYDPEEKIAVTGQFRKQIDGIGLFHCLIL
jgi:hypothetical protein